MSLLVLVLFYLLGLALGRNLWEGGWIGCELSTTYWIGPLLIIPLLLHRHLQATEPIGELRWPISAGFQPPRPHTTSWLIVACIVILVTGVLRYIDRPHQPCRQPSHLAYYNTPADKTPSMVSVEGRVSGYPHLSEGRTRLDLEVSRIWAGGQTRRVVGRVRLTVSERTQFSYGDLLRVSGLLIEPPLLDGFDYRAYLAGRGIHSLLRRPRVESRESGGGSLFFRLVYALRDRGVALINRSLPEPYAALANGMILGVEAGIPDDLYERFNRTGASHVIVISGSNIALVAGLLMALSMRLLGKRRALWPTLAGISFYALLVGGDGAVMRAALMGSLFTLATVLNRPSTAIISLGVACGVMTLYNPLMLWDLGFQLSSAATAGLILFGSSLNRRFDELFRRRASTDAGISEGRERPITTGGRTVAPIARLLGQMLQEGLLMTIAANLTTLPLIVYYFGRLSPISLLTNLLIAPVQPYIMIWGGGALLVGLLGVPLMPTLIFSVPFLSLWWTVAIVEWTAALPGASVEIGCFGEGALFTSYLALALFVGRRWIGHRLRLLGALMTGRRNGACRAIASARKERALKRSAAPMSAVSFSSLRALLRLSFGGGPLAFLGVAALMVHLIGLGQPDGRLHVYFLDIGQGDGVLIETPSGRQVLIDGGGDPQRLFQELGEALPFWDRTLDITLLTHPDWDHMGAQIGLVERFSLEHAMESASLIDHEDGDPWREALAEEQVDTIAGARGGWIDLGDGVALWLLWPPSEIQTGEEDKNERSLIARLVYGNFSLLLTGDAGIPTERALLQTGLPLGSTVLKVGHHGSDSSSGAQFLAAVAPHIAVIQVGENRYGHPSPDVVEALSTTLLLRNDEQGTIHLRSDGQRLWLETERNLDYGAFMAPTTGR